MSEVTRYPFYPYFTKDSHSGGTFDFPLRPVSYKLPDVQTEYDFARVPGRPGHHPFGVNLSARSGIEITYLFYYNSEAEFQQISSQIYDLFAPHTGAFNLYFDRSPEQYLRVVKEGAVDIVRQPGNWSAKVTVRFTTHDLPFFQSEEYSTFNITGANVEYFNPSQYQLDPRITDTTIEIHMTGSSAFGISIDHYYGTFAYEGPLVAGDVLTLQGGMVYKNGQKDIWNSNGGSIILVPRTGYLTVNGTTAYNMTVTSKLYYY